MRPTKNIIAIIAIVISIFSSAASFAQGKIERPQKEPQKSTVAKPVKKKQSKQKQAIVTTVSNSQTQNVTDETNKQNDDSSKQETSIKEEGKINGFKYVDLGLPSGTKWANRNIGADYPQENGNYFAWGEIFAKTNYIKENSLTQGQDTSSLRSKGIVNSNSVLSTSSDAAKARWGSTWRVPTKADFEELESHCNWTWTEYRGKYGFKITGKNGNSIFLPASGCINNRACNFNGQNGIYTISTVHSAPDRAYAYIFGSKEHYVSWRFRFIGSVVRPVSN